MTRVVVCLDGFDPAYLDAVETPNWDALATRGTGGTCECVVPSLTNVNNVSIATAAFPDEHGITGNSYYDRETDELVYMRTPDYRRTDTWLTDAVARRATDSRASSGDGTEPEVSTAAIVVKEKLERLVGEGCACAASAESPPADLEAAVGSAPDIYSGDASAWVLDAARHVLAERDPDVLYVSTTDVVPHKHAPGEEAADEWVRTLDDALGVLAEDADRLVATADHGMREKTLCVDLDALLEAEGVDAQVVRLIRDGHTYHHRNLGGAAYVYLDDPAAASLLEGVEGVDEVLSRDAAAERFHLPPDRIGDAMVLGTPESVFGPVGEGDVNAVDTADATHADVSVRSHGSHHERTVPYVATEEGAIDYNLEAWSLVR